MKTYLWNTLTLDAQNAALARPEGLSNEPLLKQVRDIMDAVKTGGDKAVLDFTYDFDDVRLNNLHVPKEALKSAWENLVPNAQDAINIAIENIKKFHTAQIPKNISVETMPGVLCQREARAIEIAGLYIPGGTAPLVSTLLMLAVPAKVAGVNQRIVVTPPAKDGKINQAILAAAHRCAVTDVYACGGAQAIAALAYGTKSIPKCNKIFGPGNAYVTTAKSLAAQEAGGPAIDMPAGPSEAMVVADESANPVFVASDLLSQAEHDTLAQVMCVCSTADIARKVQDAVQEQVKTLPRRNIANQALKFSRFLITPSRTATVEIINRYAPEHLILQIENPRNLVADIHNAGSIFLGPWTPESVGDYASGTNHTLPTFGAARAYSGVTLESFMKYISIQELTRKGLEALGPTVETLATLEGLEAHRRAISLRLETEAP